MTPPGARASSSRARLSALAAPLSADIVLTEKTVGRHFSVASAHDPDALDFTAFAGIDTCVFLMVGRTLEKVVQRLGMSRDEGGAGVPGDVPAAAIRWGCTERETTFRSTPEGTAGDATRGEELAVQLVVGPPPRACGAGKTWRTRGLNIRADATGGSLHDLSSLFITCLRV